VPATDGNNNLSWITPVTGGPYLPLSGGTITGSLTVNQVLTVQGPNSLVLNAPLNNPRAILAQAAGITRWVLNLGDQTNEGLNNVGANFSLQAYSTTGVSLGTWLSIARADGSTTFNGSGVTIQGGLAVNGLLALADPTHLAIYGGAAGQVLTTNGSGVLSWATPSGASITVSDTAPASPVSGALWWDSVGGQLYLWYSDANSSQWVVAINAASLLQPASTTVLGSVKVDGTTIKAAADGTISTTVVPMGDNRIINGDMRIDQRNNGAAGTAQNVYTVDRWLYNATQASKGTWQRGGGSAGVVAATSFGWCLSFTSSSAYALAAGDTFTFYQPLEADMISDFAWGTASAQPVTLSFWVYSSLSGTFSGAIRNTPQNRSYPFSFSLTANTWTKTVLTIPGDTAGTWTLIGNGVGLYLNFDLGTGATYRGPANAWASANYVGANGAVNVVATNGATFNVTGVKLEIGTVATPYNRQSLAKSMADCQRYYQVISPTVRVVAANAGQSSDSNVSFQIMRATPTVTYGSASSSANINAVTLNVISSNSARLGLTSAAAGDSYVIGQQCNLSAEL
jgi:hypothetical protein